MPNKKKKKRNYGFNKIKGHASKHDVWTWVLVLVPLVFILLTFSVATGF